MHAFGGFIGDRIGCVRRKCTLNAPNSGRNESKPHRNDGGQMIIMIG